MVSPDLAVVILAAGDSARYGGTLKQALSIDGMPLVQRTLNACARRGLVATLVTHRASEFSQLGITTPRIYVPQARRWTCESLLSTRPLWGNVGTIVLLGDVLYSEACLDAIAAGQTMFYAGEAELWGLHLAAKWYERAERTLTSVVTAAQQTQTVMGQSDHGYGQLWRLYRLWYGLPFLGAFAATPGLCFQLCGTTQVVFDQTVDFDTPLDYARWQDGLRGRRAWWTPERVRDWWQPSCLDPALDWCVGHRTLEWHLPGWYCRRAVARHIGFAKCTSQACPRYEPLGERP